MIVSLVSIMMSALYEVLLPGNKVSQSRESVESRIEILLSSTNVISNGWLKSANRDTLLKEVWELNVSNNWDRNGISVYLFKGDSMLFWYNHLYVNHELDSVLVAGSDVAVNLDGRESLIFTSRQGEYSAVSVIMLYDDQSGANRAIFGNSSIRIQSALDTANTHRVAETFHAAGKTFSATLPFHQRGSGFFGTMGWLGLLGLVYALSFCLSRRTQRSTVWKHLAIVTISLLALRVWLYYVDFPQGGSNSWSSLGAVLVNQIGLLMWMNYIYSVRQKMAYRIKRLSRVGRYVALIVATIAVCVTIVIFHYSIVQIIYRDTLSVEIYNIFSMSSDGLIFYFICAVFAAYRILYSLMSRIFFDKIAGWKYALISSSILALMVLPIQSEIGYTGYYLIGFHLVFVIFMSLRSKFSVSRIFITDLIILVLYIVIFTINENRTVKRNSALEYAAQIKSGNRDAMTRYADFTYSIITHRNIEIKIGHQIDLSLLTPYLASKEQQIVSVGNYTHIIEPVHDEVVIVSYPNDTILDLVSLFSYVFVGLYLVSGLMLRVLGVDVYDQHSYRTLANRVRFMIVGTVFVAMVFVAWMVYQYSIDNHQARQRELLNASVGGLVESFNKFCGDNIDPSIDPPNKDSIINHWYASQGSAFSAAIKLYNKDGVKIGGKAGNSPMASMIDHDAWQSLVYNSMPYFDKHQNVQYTAYTALFINNKRAGYLSVTSSERQTNLFSRFWLLGNVFNAFIVLILISVLISVILYSFISGPLRILTHSLSGIGKLQKIPIRKGARMDDEVGRLIVQYNKMVDYLEESYLALARSERERAWREMARQVAHEIKNPLTPMRLKIQMLQRAKALGVKDLDSKIDSTLILLLEQIDILTNIASEFSDLARLEQGEIVRIELDSVVSSIVDLYANNSPCISINFRPETPSPLFVMVSYVPLSRLFVNLLQNAIQSINESGSITVRLSEHQGMAIIEVEDSGRGIEPDLLERIFEPNFTTRSSGSGLGLAMCRQIAASFRGSITVRSTVGQGSVFTVRLPLV